MKVSVNVILASLLVVAFSSNVIADEVKPEDAIKYRKSVMTVMNWQFKPLGAMVKGDRPFDKDVFIKNAAYLEVLSKMPLEGFIAGSDKGETKAKPEIWAEMEKFKGGMEKLQAETAKLAQVSKTGDMNQIKAQFGETGKTCKACHDNFKSK
ncbi:c-type cytochrome [Sulfurirhabdus autotrophica]|uniref:Cytochrome c556 n=1 Tax=Sulfurirhabdus autotrophica TaxID=1706046 RepID=A0A4R3Y802_9PROT|nr:cytochrome c [Sulfurirhabdus autotrophica]TCV86413.1 cytochrome c556 [Sulfurirhabdus autotrophica]